MSETKAANPVKEADTPVKVCRAVLVPDGNSDEKSAVPERFGSDNLQVFLEGLFSRLAEMRAGYAFVTIDGKDFNISALQPRFLLTNGTDTLVVEHPARPIFNENGRFEFKLL